MTMTLRINEADQKLIQDFARLHNMSVSEFLRRAALEKIEDELDIQLAEKAYAAYKANPATYTMDEIKKEFGLS